MNAATLRCTRERMGLPVEWLAGWLGVAPRTVHRWEAGIRPVPDGVAHDVGWLESATWLAVWAVVKATQDDPDLCVLLTYRTDWDYRKAEPTATLPASWHRAVMDSAVMLRGGLALDYWEEGRPALKITPTMLQPQATQHNEGE